MRILSRLVNNCRESDRQIGRAAGISGNAVGSRIRKMEGAGVIRGYTVKIEPPALGYGIFYAVVAGDRADERVGQIRLVGDPFFIVPCVGGVTVFGVVAKENVQEKIELARGVMKGVRVLTIFEAQAGGGAGPDLTRTDLEIIEALLDDPRKRIEAVAREAGLSTRTVARSLDKLHANEDVQFTAVYDPSRLGGYIPYAVLTWISGDMKRIKGRFDRKFGGAYMQIPFLTRNQIVLFMYSDNIFKLDEVTQEIRRIRGVEATDIFIPKEISFPHAWVRGAVEEAKRSPTLHLARQIS